MLRDDIKKILGICNDDFDVIIGNYIQSAERDLEMTGVAVNDGDPLIITAIINYVCSQIDEEKRELYWNSYELNKDHLRHFKYYRR